MTTFPTHLVRRPPPTAIMLLVAAPASAYPAANVADPSIQAGCLDPGATMFTWVTKAGVGTEYLYIVDDDGDGLPNKAYCAGGSTAVTLTPSSPSVGSTCSSLQTIGTGGGSGCDFTIKVYMGTAGNDNDGVGNPIDCSAVAHPVLFFGGGGNDKFTGTVNGDFGNGGIGSDLLDGDDGPDFLCLNQDTGDANYGYGNNGSDLVWGALNVDTPYGNDDPDFVHGAVDADFVYGNQDPDYVFGGSHPDTCDGGGDGDVVHTGESNSAETVTANDSAGDKIFAADDNVDNITADGTIYDTCYYDASDSYTCTDVTGNDREVCPSEYPFLVATVGGDHPELFELAFDAAVGEHRFVWHDGGGFPDRIVSLAVDPVDCDGLTVVLEYGADQYLGHIDLASEPAFELGVGVVYEVTDVEGPLEDTLVDIAFDFESNLGGLTTSAEFVGVDPSDGSLTPLGLAGPAAAWGHGPQGFHMAFDDPDGGLFLTLTEDPNPDGYSGHGTLAALVAHHPPTGLGTPHEDHIHEDAIWPFTVTNVGYGQLFTLAPEGTNSCGAGQFRYTMINRRDWEFAAWNFFDACDSSPCCAELGEGVEVTAITIPHYVVLPE